MSGGSPEARIRSRKSWYHDTNENAVFSGKGTCSGQEAAQGDGGDFAS
jgi:hypothetical protein